MGKHHTLTKISGPHGRESSTVHKRHQKQNKDRLERKLIFTAHEVIKDQPKFRSDVSGLSDGRNWIMENGKWRQVEGEIWDDEMSRLEVEYSWFHQRQRNKHKEGFKISYRHRNIKDREKLSETDVHARPDTDVERETVDLRPDHSKVIEYLLKVGRRDDLLPVIDQIRMEIVRLFEEIYERYAICLGEHDDSGQFHNDIWSTGIYEQKVPDSGALVTGKADAEVAVKPGEEKVVRLRKLFRAYGVGVGMASFDRHRRALEEAGLSGAEVMGWTAEVLTRNAEVAAGRKRAKCAVKGQVCEEARDLRLYSKLDEFVAAKLKALDPQIYDRAAAEYVAFLNDGYAGKKLGLKEETAEISKLKRRIEDLEATVKMTKGADALLELQQKLKQSQQAELEVKKELKSLRLLRELVQRLWDRLISTGKMVKLLEVVGRQAREIFGLIAKEIGRDLPDKKGPER